MSTEMQGDGQTAVEGEGKRLLDEARNRGSEIGRQVKSEADHVMGELRVRARDEGNEQAHRAAGALRGVAQQLGGMAEGTVGQGKVVDLTRQGAQQIERFAERLDRDGMDGLLNDLQSFARRRPGAFLAAGFGLGMVLGRLIRSSDVGQEHEATSGYGMGAAGQYPRDTSPRWQDQGQTYGREFTPGSYSGDVTNALAQAGPDQADDLDEVSAAVRRADEPADRMP